MAISNSRWNIRRAAILATAFVSGVLSEDLLVTSGFSNCETDSNIEVQKVDISYNNNDKTVVFDVVGTSDKEQNVTATLSVTAYGMDVYTNSFNPCNATTFVSNLCPGMSIYSNSPIISVQLLTIDQFRKEDLVPTGHRQSPSNMLTPFLPLPSRYPILQHKQHYS